MKSGKQIKSVIGFVCIIISILMIGCTVKVSLSNYIPVLADDYSEYKGKRVYLMNFDNQANNTSILKYYSLDKKFTYSKPLDSSGLKRTPLSYEDLIHNYFWYAFKDAFTKLQMLISTVDNPDLTAPAMWLTLLSITDVNYDVKVTVQKKDIIAFTKPYTILEPPLSEKDRNPDDLEQRAYRMTTRLIETIMGDPDLRKVLTEP